MSHSSKIRGLLKATRGIRGVLLIAILLMAHTVAGAQQGGQQPPTPAPAPQPQPTPREPRPAPMPDPTAARPTNIGGRLIGGSPRQMERMIELKIEGQSSENIGFAYTDPSGEFQFRSVIIRPDQLYYLVVNAEGFKPIRERLDYINTGGRITIFLEPDIPADSDDNRAGTVGLKQLQAKIPGKALDEYKKALQQSTKGNYTKTIEHLERATKLAPDFYEAQNNLGAQYLRSRRFAEAEKAFEHARGLNPAAAEPLVNLGSLYYQQGELQRESGKAEESAVAFAKAVDFLDEAIRRNPGSAAAYQYLGAALYKTASYERAETTLRRALELDVKTDEVQLVLMNVYTRQNRFMEALEIVNAYLEKNPKSAQRSGVEKLKEQIETVLRKTEQVP